jgi:hypothetical protein
MKFEILQAESGSAVLEFLAFVLVGQLLVFSGFMTVADSLDRKVRLELFVAQMAKSQANGITSSLPSVLADDYGLQGVRVIEANCSPNLICLVATFGDLSASGIGIKRG